ncbi:tRNA (adenosine(37)-N6)-threonylcarbamoyltransferase complex dimerization subunit type 1 TsaB [Pullulanibacillus sp. KACC 23026]|uniref:tRNA (adenosine(37)-N6)-threonylcarbamoyltransferase complex dimerization subunit type 1 TsaB n=1 Tax=Pullulanibacillus sp. KACC 23026 TaxID=3028315 RepID=UPI0023AEA445|nr:tRNA (adenosine(37)-N6)-threonylcarbamoyltransferase complex dimerization subunit type 1 TsaB [Pullulanibacillus sp. KACC 23026]WEG12513.1 tRNA (adenosine(37)-N6)-threonylcarbamoyltransferase complex dimerization subunit type 1 TsaB [Pullulanibacillus sp. KACC 23026]
MKILAIDSSTTVMGVAVMEDRKLLAEYTTNLKLNHSVRLMPAIERVLSEVELSPQDLDRIAVAKGPGSYTGVRMGVTVAKTLAWTLKKELVGVSTLQVLAQNGTFFTGMVAPFFDARRDRVYAGLYKEGESHLNPVIQDAIVSVDEWLLSLKNRNEAILFVGQDLSAFESRIRSALGEQAVFAPPSLTIPRPAELARVGAALSPEEMVHQFVPEYLQMAEAEAKWQANQKKTLN